MNELQARVKVSMAMIHVTREVFNPSHGHIHRILELLNAVHGRVYHVRMPPSRTVSVDAVRFGAIIRRLRLRRGWTITKREPALWRRCAE